ncbi:hypothetical protein GCM10022381_01370 [Leifsonia kafniensis]|uniref:Transcriptional regulator n=1 Tax=Leifsonia kafniensis TaxID=475957 RepID=A0ABP7JZN1_9MICO
MQEVVLPAAEQWHLPGVVAAHGDESPVCVHCCVATAELADLARPKTGTGAELEQHGGVARTGGSVLTTGPELEVPQLGLGVLFRTLNELGITVTLAYPTGDGNTNDDDA